MHGEQLVVLLIGEECQPRRGELGADEQRHQATDHEEGETCDQIHDADQLVIGGGNKPVDKRAFRPYARGKRTTCRQLDR
ncbi:Uncharacterised protein [Mycobacteroides abscessus subsp. abscessus]|nr:Uncharacterised protein [Mycobacteroides abscessus subsp. abscessus]SIM98966.1 Uncharacterised protein [Mycobacteroides abscessus subsp. abscessus]SKS99942.1 Uncharacterised protein [Mycobacteroides abscessus subsp. abscessus]